MKEFENLHLALAAFVASHNAQCKTFNEWYKGDVAFPDASILEKEVVRINNPINHTALYITLDQEEIFLVRVDPHDAWILYQGVFTYHSLYIICTHHSGNFLMTTKGLIAKLREAAFRADAAFSTAAGD